MTVRFDAWFTNLLSNCTLLGIAGMKQHLLLLILVGKSGKGETNSFLSTRSPTLWLSIGVSASQFWTLISLILILLLTALVNQTHVLHVTCPACPHHHLIPLKSNVTPPSPLQIRGQLQLLFAEICVACLLMAMFGPSLAFPLFRLNA